MWIFQGVTSQHQLHSPMGPRFGFGIRNIATSTMGRKSEEKIPISLSLAISSRQIL